MILNERTISYLNEPRWAYGTPSLYSLQNGCPFCGTMAGHGSRHMPCKPATCMLCGTVQCFEGGPSCRACHYGFIPGWSGTSGQECGYAGCKGEAVAKVPGRKLACMAHARRKCGPQVDAWLQERDAGRGWQKWMFLDRPRVPWSVPA